MILKEKLTYGFIAISMISGNSLNATQHPQDGLDPGPHTTSPLSSRVSASGKGPKMSSMTSTPSGRGASARSGRQHPAKALDSVTTDLLKQLQGLATLMGQPTPPDPDAEQQSEEEEGQQPSTRRGLTFMPDAGGDVDGEAEDDDDRARVVGSSMSSRLFPSQTSSSRRGGGGGGASSTSASADATGVRPDDTVSGPVSLRVGNPSFAPRGASVDGGLFNFVSSDAHGPGLHYIPSGQEGLPDQLALTYISVEPKSHLSIALVRILQTKLFCRPPGTLPPGVIVVPCLRLWNWYYLCTMGSEVTTPTTPAPELTAASAAAAAASASASGAAVGRGNPLFPSLTAGGAATLSSPAATAAAPSRAPASAAAVAASTTSLTTTPSLSVPMDVLRMMRAPLLKFIGDNLNIPNLAHATEFATLFLAGVRDDQTFPDKRFFIKNHGERDHTMVSVMSFRKLETYLQILPLMLEVIGKSAETKPLLVQWLPTLFAMLGASENIKQAGRTYSLSMVTQTYPSVSLLSTFYSDTNVYSGPPIVGFGDFLICEIGKLVGIALKRDPRGTLRTAGAEDSAEQLAKMQGVIDQMRDRRGGRYGLV